MSDPIVQSSLQARAKLGCEICGSPGEHWPVQVDVPEFVMFACGAFIDDCGSFEESMQQFAGAETPCEQIARLVRELADQFPGSKYADRVAGFRKDDDDAAA